jgi:outer membrane protein TolC
MADCRKQILAALMLSTCIGCHIHLMESEPELYGPNAAHSDPALQVTAESQSAIYDSSPAVNIPAKPMSTASWNAEAPEWRLSINDAIMLTLQGNRRLMVSQYQRDINCQQILAEESIYDPVISVGTQWSEADSQLMSVVEGPGGNTTVQNVDQLGPPRGLGDQAGVSRRLPTGGEFSAGVSSSYQFTTPPGPFLIYNPAVRSTAFVEFTQPLIRGSGQDITEIRIRMAETAFQSENHRMEIQIRQTVTETAIAYWALFGTRAMLASREQGVKESEAILKAETERLELGDSSRQDVAAATAKLEEFRVHRARTQRFVADAERRLRSLMGVPLEDGRKIVPTTTPLTEEWATDWDTSAQLAITCRPEVHLQRSVLQEAEFEHFAADDNLRPDIEGYAGWGLSGLDTQLGGSLEQLATMDYENWWAGIVYRHELGGRRARSLYEQAQLKLCRQKATIELTEEEIFEELHSAYQQLMNAWEVLQLTESQRTSAADVLSARKDMHSLGELDLQDYLSSLSEWEQAVAAQQAAIGDYNAAVIQWEFARGTILEHQHVYLGSTPLPPESTTELQQAPAEVPQMLTGPVP